MAETTRRPGTRLKETTKLSEATRRAEGAKPREGTRLAEATRLALQDRRYPTMAEAALAELHEGILTGRFPPGTPLRLEELAQLLGMSVSPVREAVRQLVSLGLAEHVPHRGARVSELAIDDLRDTYEMRLVLEPVAVSRAAERFTDADAAFARERLAEYARAQRQGNSRAARKAHTEFHLALYAASGSPWLLRLIRPLWENCERYRAASQLVGRDAFDRRQREHERILDACVRHDPKAAARALRLHLIAVANLVARKMGSPKLFPNLTDDACGESDSSS